MRVTKVEFQGYQRLVDTSCSTAGKMIAFLGPNEAGKTTVLNALDWYSNGAGELPSANRNQNDPLADDDFVVRVTYWLDKNDQAALNGLGLAELPKTYTRYRLPTGKYVSAVHPSARRDAHPFEAARTAFLDVLAAEPEVEADDDESEHRLANWSSTVELALADPEGAWQEDWDEAYQAAIDYIENQGNVDLPAELDRLRSVLNVAHPETNAREILRQRAPRFAMFSDDDRALKSSYDLEDAATRDDPPAALANLAWVADLELNNLWKAIEADNRRATNTMERRANEKLEARLGSRWSQRELTVEFNVDGRRLEVLINERADDGAITPIGERSDGLRTFIALGAFLARHDFTTPPVLLVDEAETHLHYDAQADLIEILTNDVEATQVFYTTHSPGCLPRDLGTGVRLVAPMENRSDASRLRNDFWTSDNSPGFTPLLFAMGAGAAAFSAFRRAVLTEGAGDMILLPSLLRRVINKSDLDFQIAPGIANYHGTGLELEEVAARVVYLVDGDEGGDVHRQRLTDMGIPDDRIKQFAAPTAVEDYVHPDRYLGLINELLELAGHDETISIDDLDHRVSIGKAVELWGKQRGVATPGKTIIASLLVDDLDALRLADGAKERLTSLHGELTKALNARPPKRPR